MFVGQLLAYAAMDEGLEVTWIPSYGPEMRGGTAHCFVVISDRPIGSPLVSRPGTAVVFNNPSFEKYELLVKPGGLLASNSSLIAAESQRADITFAPIPATGIADELGSMKVTNLVMLGGVLALHPVLTLDALKYALQEHIPAHRRNLLDLNFAAVDRGAEYVSSQVHA
jgi:2-oxoglutarate ferredoxin oxidoreductase subunit gamma